MPPTTCNKTHMKAAIKNKVFVSIPYCGSTPIYPPYSITLKSVVYPHPSYSVTSQRTRI